MKKTIVIIAVLTILFRISFAQQNEITDSSSDNKESPTTISSMTAYPNPFSVKTQVSFHSTEEQLVEFTVKNLLGKTVYGEKINAKVGYNTIPFHRTNISKGMYIYSLQTDTELFSKRMVIR